MVAIILYYIESLLYSIDINVVKLDLWCVLSLAGIFVHWCCRLIHSVFWIRQNVRTILLFNDDTDLDSRFKGGGERIF